MLVPGARKGGNLPTWRHASWASLVQIPTGFYAVRMWKETRAREDFTRQRSRRSPLLFDRGALVMRRCNRRSVHFRSVRHRAIASERAVPIAE